MRLPGIKSLPEANRFLESYPDTYNPRFIKEAPEPGTLHRTLPKSVNPDDVLCIKGVRTINESCLVKWRSWPFVLERPSLTLRWQPVAADQGPGPEVPGDPGAQAGRA